MCAHELLTVVAIVAMFLFTLIILDAILDHCDSDKSYKCPNCRHISKNKEGKL